MQVKTVVRRKSLVENLNAIGAQTIEYSLFCVMNLSVEKLDEECLHFGAEFFKLTSIGV